MALATTLYWWIQWVENHSKRSQLAHDAPAITVKILKHLGLPTRAPPRKLARYRDIYDSS